jgi:hypothetical protein
LGGNIQWKSIPLEKISREVVRPHPRTGGAMTRQEAEGLIFRWANALNIHQKVLIDCHARGVALLKPGNLKWDITWIDPNATYDIMNIEAWEMEQKSP